MLVAPVVTVNPREERIVEFKGLNKRPMIEDGEMRDMWNIGADEYPYLSQRRSREVLEHEYTEPMQMLVKYEKLAVIDRESASVYRFYYDGKSTDLTFSTCPRMIAIGSKICFFAKGIHKWYQVKDIDGVAAGSFGDLGAERNYTNDIGVVMAPDGIGLQPKDQGMYEYDPNVMYGLDSIITPAHETEDILLSLGRRNGKSPQTKVTVQATLDKPAQFVTFEVGTHESAQGYDAYKYAGYRHIDNTGTFTIDEEIDLRGYDYTDGIGIRVKAWCADGTCYWESVAAYSPGYDCPWTLADMQSLDTLKRLSDIFKVDDVIDITGSARRESMDMNMTQAEYNEIADLLGLPHTTTDIVPTITQSDYNDIAAYLGLAEEVETDPAAEIDNTMTETEVYELGTKLGLINKDEGRDNYGIGNIDTAVCVNKIEGDKIRCEDNTFPLNLVRSVVDYTETENTYTIDNPASVVDPKPELVNVFRSKALAGWCLAIWKVQCPADSGGTRRNATTYLFQIREVGSTGEWATTYTMSKGSANLPDVKENATSVFATEIQVPHVDAEYEFRIIAVKDGQTTAQTGNMANYPRCKALNEIYIMLGNLSLTRFVPDMEFVMEYNNRIWGCNNEDNEILACKLGDPTNWHYYQGTSMDSYAATQGTDGEWTGCAAYSNHLLFFKEDHIHKVYGTSPASFQTATQRAHGVQKGSSKSVSIVNDVVLYHSRVGFMAYQGEAPENISTKLGEIGYKDVVAGTDRKKYYCTAYNGSEWEFLIFDTETGFWLKEDGTHADEFCFFDGCVIYSTPDGDLVRIGTGDEQDIEWYAIFGPFTEYIEDTKVVSKLKMRLNLAERSYADVQIRCDEEEWILVDEFEKADGQAHDVMIVPRRCDRFEVKLSGKGRCRVDSLVRQYRVTRGKP